ncbi:MAG: hypothetical protein H6R17_1332 [Proteobacteria bacterium]|nr:hypothetical protein [Pseudomonadota bacterium]
MRNSPETCRRWHRLSKKLLRGFVLGLTLGLALTTAGLMH